jgi:transcriptional regulatory protein RtcR
VEEEIDRLKVSWRVHAPEACDDRVEQLLDKERLDQLDLFDRLQLESVIKVCRESRSLSEAGRKLFTASRGRKKSANDADRLRKYLARFGLEWSQVREASHMKME